MLGKFSYVKVSAACLLISQDSGGLTLLIDAFNYLCTHNISTHTHTQIVTASSLVGRPDIMKVDLLFQIFHDAFKYVHVYQCECFYIYTLIIATLGPCA